jgi:glycosyltransferase involved in cell wall biosynthesis
MRPDPAPPLALTFILPTRNRRQWVGRAIDSCLLAHQSGVCVEVLVIDGNSTDGSFEWVQQRYGADPRVRLLRQQGPKGFMPACFFAVPQVRTPFVTFMYDDDVLSCYWADLPRELQRRGSGFIMGFGTEEDVARCASFERVTSLRLVSPSFLLRAFHGCGRELSRHDPPFSPICCLTRTDWLREWTREVEQFTRGRPLREHFMIQRNAGPDLMIYLYSIVNHSEEIVVFDGPVAQFSTHSESMTSGFTKTDLTIGYWLPRIWLCDRLCALGRHADAGWCAAYTVKQGVRLVLKRLRRGEPLWLASLLKEIAALTGRTISAPSAFWFAKSFLTLLLPRGWRPRFGLSGRAEQLVS